MFVEEWLGLDNQIGIDIWHNKYQYENETFDEWLDRVSGGNEDVRKLIVEKKFLFGGRILSNRGLDKLGKKITLSNCYVIAPPEDNIESIFECASKLARTYSYGGGCGIDISKLAPRGAVINNSAKSTTGSVSFMELYDLVTGLIGQNGRRGAMMISLSCDHPDLEEFIGIKSDLNEVTNANISIRITDDFMKAVANKWPFKLEYVRTETGEVITKTVNAYDVFRKICEMNWNYAEPGVLFWNNIESDNLLALDDEFFYAGTNPCAEEPLPAGGSCLLGSINLSEFVDSYGEFDYEEFHNTVSIAVIALNEVLDEGMELHPLQEQRESVRDWRQIGLGIFGLADMLIKMGIKYGSYEALNVCDKIARIMFNSAVTESANLAALQGPYPKYKKNQVMASGFLNSNASEETINAVELYGLRNSQLLTIAPTGTLSTMLGVSGGIEPIFANSYERKTESLHGRDEYYKIYTPIVKQYMDYHDLADESELPFYFVTANQINYKDRIDMQAIWQNYIDASISSTINLPNETTVEEVMSAYKYAWESNLKGLTIFREGCDRNPILSTKTEKEEKSESKELGRGEVIKVSDNCVGLKRTLQTGCGTLHCEAFFDPETGELLETYLSKGSTGGCNNFMVGLSRMISLSARGGIDIYHIVDQLKSSGTCPSYAVRRATKGDTSVGSSCPVAVGNALLDMYEQLSNIIKDVEIENEPVTNDNSDKCPKCGASMIDTGGCHECKFCGFSRCE